MKYLDTIKAVEKYLASHRVVTDHGIYWDITDSFHGPWKYYDEISLYAGSAGIAKFYLDLFNAFGDQYYLDQASQAGDYLAWRWHNQRHMKKAFSQYAITTGYSGVAFILNELFTLTNKPAFAETVREILNQIIADQTAEGVWSGQIGVVADGGTVLLLLQLGKKYQVKGVEAAVRKFGDYVLAHQHEDQLGKYYVGLDLKFVGGPIGKFNTGFPLGPAGVAFVLLKIWQLTGDDRYRQGTDGIDDFYRNNSIKDDQLVLPHYFPDDEHINYVGYCGGPTGTSRYFYLEYLLTKNPHDLMLFRQAVDGVAALGAPEERSAGFWELDNYCCSTAGILQMYVGAYLATGDDRYFKRAQVAAEVIESRVNVDAGQAKWVQAFERKNPDIKTAALGYYDGAAGIAASLLQFYLLATDPAKLQVHRMLDDPYPSEVVKNV